jgi:cytoskeletal protein CcmA (bactofilin family)
MSDVKASRKETTIEEGTTFRGSISSDCGIVVHGGLEGEIKGPSLRVSPAGFVSGKVTVGELHSEGELSGEFDAEVVRLSGRVKDKTVIRARSIDVQLKPADGKLEVVFGECALEVGEVHSKEDAVSAAKQSPAGDAAESEPANGERPDNDRPRPLPPPN